MDADIATFADVRAGHPAAECIAAVVAARVIAPLSVNPRLFGPDYAVTRAQLAVYLSRALNIDPHETAEATFADMPETHWAHGYVEAIYSRGIMSGTADQHPCFMPDEAVTRAAIAVALCRARGLGELRPNQPTFADVPLDYWAYGWVERLADRDSWSGMLVAEPCDPGPPPRFCPDEPVTRASLAVLLCRAFGIGQ
jgi:hypothetical protein